MKKEDFANTMRRGRRVRKELFLAYIMPNKTPDTQLGIIISKKVKKNAVDRNRIRRRIREAFMRSPKQDGINVVVVPVARAIDAPFQELLEELKKALQ